ncbi:MAG TPA: DUF1552 domain-containing protein [Terriglobia bacterium]|nr:DUF1552 domain-containing protein [Terriglobia bacterium]
MFIHKKHLSRRTLLKGAGVTLALPFLDAMVPALTAQSRTAANAGPRLSFVYLPHGAIMDKWTPKKEGTGFEFTPILEALKPYRDQLNVISGLAHAAADTSAVHALSPTTWLSGIRPKATQGEDALAGITADQIAAQKIGQDTLLPSLEIGTEDRSGMSGSCDRDYGCIYMNAMSWRTPTMPLPIEINPRKAFDRMFVARSKEDSSILDAVMSQVSDLQRQMGVKDREAVNDYTDSIREVERRIQKASSSPAANDPTLPPAPAGIPSSYEEHVKMMYDLLVLAYRANITRVSTYMVSRETSNRTYPQLGVPDGHHEISHHQNLPEAIKKNIKIQIYHVGLFAQFIEKMRTTPDGAGSLLDNSIVLFGSNMSNSNLHDHFPLPNLLVGKGAGNLKGGRHIKYPDRTPMTNLLLTLLDKAGVPLDKLGDSTGKLADL